MGQNKRQYPKLRFKGFTDPWEQRKLNKLVKSFDKDRIPVESRDRKKGIYPYYGATGIVDYVDNYIFNGEYVLLAEDGANITMRTNPVTYKTHGKFWVNNHAHVFQTLTNTDSDFLVNILEKINYIKYNTGTAQPKLNAQTVSKIEITTPGLNEQKKIGILLNRVEKLIASNQRKVDKLKELKKGYMQKLFPKDGSNVPELRFPGFTDPWEQCKFKDIVNVRSGRDYKGLAEGTIPVYGTGGYMLSVDKALSYSENAIGIGRKGTINNPYILIAPFWTVDTLFYAIPMEQRNLNFIYGIFQIINWKQKDESTGVPSLSKSIINSVKVTVPKSEEQYIIGELLKTIDQLIASNQRKVDKLKELKKGYMQKLFV